MIVSHINLVSLTAQAPPSILEPLAPSFRTTTTTTTTTTIKPMTAAAAAVTTTTTTQIPTTIDAIPITTSPIHIYGSNIFDTDVEHSWHNLTATATATATATTITTLRTFLIGINGTLINQANGTANAISSTSTAIADGMEFRGPRYSLTSMIVIGVIAGILSLLTVVGNVLVMISFKIDKQLQTISNYFLFSLAIADFAIGLISMPLFAVSTIVGYWPLGPHICDTWLALDYLASNASVLNLLIISFDRYFSVTRPLTYRAKRTTKGAAAMIAAAWGISLILWPPWIYSWPYIEGKRTVPQDECYIQFIETNQYITFLTALAAFYTPVTIMCFLYYRIWKETKKRQKDLPNLQAGKKDSSKRSNSSDENTVINHTGVLSVTPMGTTAGLHDHESWRRPRSESSADVESVYTTNMVLDPSYIGLHSTKSSMKSMKPLRKAYPCFSSIKNWCIAWWHSGREDSDSDFHYEQEEPSDVGCPSNNIPRDNYSLGGSISGIRPPNVLLSDISRTPHRPPLTPGSRMQDVTYATASRSSRSFNSNDKIITRSISQESVYTILIRLPPDGTTTSNGIEMAPSIKMIHEDITLLSSSVLTRKPLLSSRESEYSLPPLGRRNTATSTGMGTGTGTGAGTGTGTATGMGTGTAATTATMSTAIANRGGVGGDIRIPLNAKIIPKEMGKPTQLSVSKSIAQKKKKKSQEKRQESKAAKTLSAILLSFIITWTPYNILVLIKPLTTCSDCIPSELWEFFYALCYINSTINPVCYALCNATFRRTYIRILTCKWHTRNREGMTRGVYN